MVKRERVRYPGSVSMSDLEGESEEGETIGVDPEELEQEEEKPQTNLESQLHFVTAFPEKYKKDFEGVAYLGYLQSTVTSIPLHEFKVRTLTGGEKIKVSELSAPYQNTLGFNRAYKAAVVAAGLVSIDGKPLIVSDRNVSSIDQKYEYVTNNWYDIVINALYNEIAALEKRVNDVLREMGVLRDEGS